MTEIDFYSQCEAGLMLRLMTLTQFFKHDWQVSDDDTVIAKGEDYFVVVRPGEFPNTPAARGSGLYDFDWHSTADLYVRYKEYKTSWTKFKAFRSAIIHLVFRDPTLGNVDNVWRTAVNSKEKAQYFRFSDAPASIKANFIIQTLDVIITQRVQFEML